MPGLRLAADPRSPYAAAWQRYKQDRDLHALIAGVAGVYATDPTYAHLVAQIADQANVTTAIAKARTAA